MAWLADFVGDIFSSFTNYRAQREAMQWQKDMYYHNLEYNKPINQMKRLEEAGINPHMAYARGTLNNVASPAPSLTAPQIEGLPKFADKIGQWLNLRKMKADIQSVEETNKNLEKQREKIEADIRRSNAEARVAEHDAKIIEKSGLSSKANNVQSAAQIIGNYGGALYDWYKSKLNPHSIEMGLPVIKYHKPKERKVFQLVPRNDVSYDMDYQRRKRGYFKTFSWR